MFHITGAKWEKQKRLLTAYEHIVGQLQEVMAQFCPGDQRKLYGTIRAEYITAVVGTTIELIEVGEQTEYDGGDTKHRAQFYHFDGKNDRGTTNLRLLM